MQGSKVRYIAANFVCFWAEISVQSLHFRVQNAGPAIPKCQSEYKKETLTGQLSAMSEEKKTKSQFFFLSGTGLIKQRI